MRNRILIAAALAACAAPAWSAETPRTWSGTGEFGLAVTTGNTESQTLNTKLALTRNTEDWKNSGGLSFLYGKSNGRESSRRHEVYGTTGRRLGDRSYVFGSLRAERDRYAGNEYRWIGSGGYGYEAIASDLTKLTLEIGPGYSMSKRQGLREHSERAIVRGFTDFKHKFNTNTSLYNVFLIEASTGNTFARNDFGLLVKMTTAMSLKAGLEVRHNTETPVGVKNTDTLTTLNMVYGF